MTRRFLSQPGCSAAWLTGVLLLCPFSAVVAQSGAGSGGEPPTPNYVQAIGPRGLLHWKQMPVRVYFTPGPASTPERREQARAGFDEWVRAAAGVITYRLVDAPAQADVFVTFDSASFLDERTHESGLTSLAFYGATLHKAEMRLAAGGTTPNELQEVAAHEFGHALGIDGHSDAPDDLMAPVMLRVFTPYGSPIEVPARAVTTRDLNTLKACYGVRFTASPQFAAQGADTDLDSETIEPADAPH